MGQCPQRRGGVPICGLVSYPPAPSPTNHLPLQPLPGPQREHRIRAAQLIDALAVFRFGKLVIEIPLAEPPDLVAIQIADVIAHELRRRLGLRLDPMPPQLFEHVSAVRSR
jgi:hypothetical protein